MKSYEAFRLAHHDAICANGGYTCAAREAHAKRNMNDDEAQKALDLFLGNYMGGIHAPYRP